MIRRLVLAALGLASAVSAAAQEPPVLDRAALEPVLSHAWSPGGRCEGDLKDFVIDKDGMPYLRDQGFVPLSTMSFAGGELTTTDELGVGRTTAIYKLQGDGTLRLWSEVFDEGFGAEPSDGAGPPVQRVKDGHVVIDEAGAPANPGAETPSMAPCPPRAGVVAAEAVAALNGAWGVVEGQGICPAGGESVTFDLERPVPHVFRGPFGEAPYSQAYALSIAREGGDWVVTEGSAFEASVYRFTGNADGTLTETSDYGDAPRVLARCP